MLKDKKTRKLFVEKAFELVDVGILNLWGYFMDRVLRVYDVVCGEKRFAGMKGIHGG